ncbi:MAG: Thivi_2564 family membrane protein [Silvibacterium sp.]
MQLVLTLVVVGLLLWLVNRFIPMQSSIKSILNGVVAIAVVLGSSICSAFSPHFREFM